MAIVDTVLESDLGSYLSSLGEPENKDTSKYFIYNCPYCVRCGEPTSKPKFYYYPDTRSGYCFRCGSRMMVESIFTRNNNIYQTDNETEFKVEKHDLSRLPVISLEGLKLFHEDKQVLKYVKKERCKEYVKTLKSLPAYSISRYGNLGILFPLRYGGKIRGYQIRYLKPDENGVRFYTSRGEKIPFRFDESLYHKEITLCEGVFSALGCKHLGLPNPIATLGKDLSSSVLQVLSEYSPAMIYLAFDSLEINYKVYRTLRDMFRCRFTSIAFHNGDDPDSAFRSGRGMCACFELMDYDEYAKANGVEPLEWNEVCDEEDY
ncbi:TPA: hypothetical protein SFZ31_000457 [Campylobacter jejuni]|nr:hypothetical protein [Campylobacter jejuni]